MDCNFCGTAIPRGKGTAYVYTKGKINYFCSTRCYKNGIVLHRKFNKKERRERERAAKTTA